MKIFPYFEVSVNILHSVGFLVDFPSRSRKATNHFQIFSLDEKKACKEFVFRRLSPKSEKRWGIQVLAIVPEHWQTQQRMN